MRSKHVAFPVVLLLALLAGLIAAAPSAYANDGQDRVSFGNPIVVGDGESIGDAVCFFCSIEAHGKINGDVVTFFGGVKTDSAISGDVVSFGGDVLLNDAANINGDLVVFGGNLRKSAEAHTSQSEVIFPAIIFAIPLLVIGGIIWGISALFRRRVPVYYVPPAR